MVIGSILRTPPCMNTRREADKKKMGREKKKIARRPGTKERWTGVEDREGS